MNIRDLPVQQYARILQGAPARGLRVGEYVVRLQDVHDAARQHADRFIREEQMVATDAHSP